jgi:F0F1-type ATP synthase assembly protein I
MADEKRPRQSSPKGLSGADFAGVGIQFGAAIVVFVFAGQWLDKRFDGNGLFTVGGAFVGAVGGFYHLYRRVSAAQKQDDERRRGSGP